MINDRNVQEVSELVEKHGFGLQARLLLDGASVQFGIANAIDLVIELCRKRTLIYGWQIANFNMVAGQHMSEEIGYRPKPIRQFNCDIPKFFKVDQYNRLVQREDGTYYCGGWEYSIVGEYIRSQWEGEISEPGAYKVRIQKFRNAISSAANIPTGTSVTVNLCAKVDDANSINRAKELLNKVPFQGKENSFIIELPVDTSGMYTITNLHSDMVIWNVPEDSLEVPSGLLGTPAFESTQKALF